MGFPELLCDQLSAETFWSYWFGGDDDKFVFQIDSAEMYIHKRIQQILRAGPTFSVSELSKTITYYLQAQTYQTEFVHSGETRFFVYMTFM